jgi:23S rRNA (adenine2503-C2)-methyltransferase
MSETVEIFRAALAAEKVPVFLRRPRGRDIYAACGQLKRTVEREALGQPGHPG